MILLAGADIVLAERVLQDGSLLIDGERIVAIEPRPIDTPGGATRIDVSGCVIVPGFVDVHVHGIEGHDVMDGPEAIRVVAGRLPNYGVTAFCPTSIACDPVTLQTMLTAVVAARHDDERDRARVLPAHLESNFINPAYKGAQPAQCLRTPARPASGPEERDYSGRDILDLIAAHRDGVGIVTLAPEIEGGLDLVRAFTRAGHIVSMGHTGATYEEARSAIDAGVGHATHLFNRMTAMTHRAPGVPGAVLESDHVCAELICDGFHVHPALMRLAVRAKGVDRMMAITDGTAGSGMPVGTITHLGGRRITVTERTAVLDDGTLAGSVLTMDAAFRTLVRVLHLSYVDAARLCASTPARQLGLRDTGRLEVGALADLVVLDEQLKVRHTWLRGAEWRNRSSKQLV